MLTILLTPFKNTTQYPLIGEGEITVVLLYIGITTRNMLMLQCLAILQKHFTSSNIQHLRDLNMPRITGLYQTMYQYSNKPRKNQTYQP